MAGYPNSQSNPGAAVPVWLAPAPMASGLEPKARNIAADGNTQVKTGAGYFNGLTVNTAGVGATVKLYDGTDATGLLLGTFSANAQGSVQAPGFGIPFATGLFVVVASSGTDPDITIVYA